MTCWTRTSGETTAHCLLVTPAPVVGRWRPAALETCSLVPQGRGPPPAKRLATRSSCLVHAWSGQPKCRMGRRLRNNNSCHCAPPPPLAHGLFQGQHRPVQDQGGTCFRVGPRQQGVRQGAELGHHSLKSQCLLSWLLAHWPVLRIAAGKASVFTCRPQQMHLHTRKKPAQMRTCARTWSQTGVIKRAQNESIYLLSSFWFQSRCKGLCGYARYNKVGGADAWQSLALGPLTAWAESGVGLCLTGGHLWGRECCCPACTREV